MKDVSAEVASLRQRITTNGGSVGALLQICDVLDALNHGAVRGASGEFTCPKCGGHTWGTLGTVSGIGDKYCTGGMKVKNGVAEGALECMFRWKSTEDHMYFAKSRPDGQAVEVLAEIGETDRSPSGHWFRVRRIKLGEATRIRVELMRVDRMVRALDSTDQGLRELGTILAKL